MKILGHWGGFALWAVCIGVVNVFAWSIEPTAFDSLWNLFVVVVRLMSGVGGVLTLLYGVQLLSLCSRNMSFEFREFLWCVAFLLFWCVMYYFLGLVD